MKIVKTQENKHTTTEDNFLTKYVLQKIFWSILSLILVVVINILINKYAATYFEGFAQKVSQNYMLTGFAFFISEILIGIFPAELFMMIYQSKMVSEYYLIVLVLGIISSISGFIAFIGGKYLKLAKISSVILFQKKYQEYCSLFVKYGWVILILAATTPLPFAMVCFISGYFKLSPATFIKIVIPVRIIRFFISAFFINYSLNFI